MTHSVNGNEIVMINETQPVLELVLFAVKAGTTSEEVLATSERVTAWVSGQEGFISRELLRSAEGDQWIDLVRWRTLDDARTAAKLAPQAAECQPMFSLIDLESVTMLHGQ